jgi:hypothetical protein
MKKKYTDGGRLQMGCGKGRKCSITIYVLPQSSTKEQFERYAAKREADMRNDDNVSRGGGKY